MSPFAAAMIETIFWLCFALVAYAYVAYPAIMAIWAWMKPLSVRRETNSASVSVVMAAHNEIDTIAARIHSLMDQFADSSRPWEVIVVSDGSSDGTARVARECCQSEHVSVLDLPDRAGKAAAITEACRAAKHEILVFADVRQRWSSDAIERLLERFADPQIGAVSGELVLETASGVMAGVGLYWRYEKWLRKKESQVHSTVGVTGAICAVRRRLFRPIPRGTVLDDVYWPLQVVMAGYRVVFEERALAYDRLPTKARQEFIRKVRTLSGNCQLIARLPAAILPWRNPVAFQLVSHKLMRLVVPWAMIAFLVSSVALDGWAYRLALVGQCVGYAVGIVGLIPIVGRRFRVASALGSFLVLNAAAWIAFWVWLFGKTGRSWVKVSYGITGESGQDYRTSSLEPAGERSASPRRQS